jgi:type 1 fimbria pilin
MFSTSPSRFAAIVILLIALAGAASAASNYVQIFVHPGSGTVCLDTQCEVNVGTLGGYSSTQFHDVTGGRDHTIKVYNTEGYEDYTTEIYMDYAGDPVTRTIYLDPVATPEPAATPAAGTIQLFIKPGIGEACLDDRECEVTGGDPSETWSVQFTDVETGAAHTITVTTDGYVTATREVSVDPGEMKTVEITLQPVPASQAPENTQAAQPTKAGLPAALALAGAGICGAFFVLRKKQ